MNINPKIKEAWRETEQFGYAWSSVSIVRNAYVDAEAGRRMAEFNAEHIEYGIKCECAPKYRPCCPHRR